MLRSLHRLLRLLMKAVSLTPRSVSMNLHHPSTHNSTTCFAEHFHVYPIFPTITHALTHPCTSSVVHASDIPYVFGPSLTPYINAPLDIALSHIVQKAWISFATHLDPNFLGDLGGI